MKVLYMSAIIRKTTCIHNSLEYFCSPYTTWVIDIHSLLMVITYFTVIINKNTNYVITDNY